MAAAAAAKSLQSCPTLCNPMNRSTPGLIKLKRFCTAKEIISKVKDNPQNGKIIANETIDKGLISKI